MAFDVISYALSSKIAESAVSGVDSMSVDGTTLTINCVDGNVLEMEFPIPKDGADGVSVVDIDMNENHELIFIMSDGSEIAAGQVDVIKGDKGDQGEKGDKGDTGYSPTITENAANTEDNYKLDITNETNTFTTPNLKGKPGVQGIQGSQGIQGEKGEPGPVGEAGVSPTITENENNSDTVYKLDITDVNGTFTTQNLVGKQGAQGIQGERGLQGEQGIQGLPGVSPTLVVNPDNTDEVYRLDITDSNGTFTTPNLIGRQGAQGIQGERGLQGEQGIQGIQGIKGEKGNDGYPFLIYKEYTSLDEFDPSHFPEIGLMFMVRDGSSENVPVYRYTGEADNPYSHTTDMATAEGLKGDKGDKGDTGEQGIQGEKGNDGITYTPVIGTIATVTSESDATADVIVDSETKTATFNFSIPRGVQGIQGIPGEQGIQGEKGADGSTYTPAIGTVTTVNAASEASADIVLDNDNKIARFNFSIPRGAQGLQGLQGKQGEQGEAGIAGKDGTTYTPAIGTVTTVSSNEEASASVSTTMDESKLAIFDFNIPKGVGVEKIEFTSSSLGDVAGLPGATDTYTITFTNATATTYEVYNGQDCGLTIDDETTSETSVWSSKKTSDEIALHTANRQVKIFDNSGSSTEKWYKICSAITGGIGCNIKLTASRADSTATVQYFSALFRDSRCRYTSSYISRERTVYESELVAEYSAYIIADANNDIWIHVPSYGKAIIEIDTRAITIDGTVGTPVEDYIYSSFEHQYDGKINDTESSNLSTYSSSKINTELNKKLHTYSKQWYGSHDRYAKLGSIPISTGSVSVGSLLVTLFASSTKLEEYPIGTISLNISSGAGVNAFNINGFSTIALNTPRTDNIYTPRIVVDKTSTHYVLYIDCSYNYLKITCSILNSTNFTFGDFETASALEGTEVWSSVTSDDIKYVGDMAKLDDSSTGDTTSTWSSSKIASYVAENAAPTYSGTVIPTKIASGATVTTDWDISSAGSNADYGRLLMLNSNAGTFLIHVKGNVGSTSTVPTPTIVSSIANTQSGTWSSSFELSISSGKLRIKNKSGAVASWRFV